MIPKFRSWVENIRHPEFSFMQYAPEFNGEINKIFENDGEIQHGVKVSYMQSTGLKDKNGVEIFEGDVVLANGVQVTVSFGEQKYEENYGDETHYIGFNVFTKMGYGMLIPVKFEVLGNIHENPELLSKPKEARL